MKKILIISVTILFVFSFFNVLYSALPYDHIPAGASYRLDRFKGNSPLLTGKWEEISYHSNETGGPEWGQFQCWHGGDECHLYDWLTWWMPSLVSEPEKPEGDYEFEYPTTLPIGYDPNTGEYLY